MDLLLALLLQLPTSGPEFVLCLPDTSSCVQCTADGACDLCVADRCTPMSPRVSVCVGDYCASCHPYRDGFVCFVNSPIGYCSGSCTSKGCGGSCT